MSVGPDGNEAHAMQINHMTEGGIQPSKYELLNTMHSPAMFTHMHASTDAKCM